MTHPHRAGRVPLHPEAFSHDLNPRRKRPRQENDAHLKFIRTLPCLVCGTRKDVQAAHLKAANPIYAKRSVGIGEKPDDKWALPQCGDHHADQHKGDELAYWRSHGIDPFKVALSLFAHSGDDEAAELVIKLARVG